jgi:hypothetical protein
MKRWTAALTLALAVPLLAHAQPADDDYKLGSDSMPQEGVPKGEVTKHTWATSKVFPGTVRDYWVYVPKQYDGSTPACVMVFQDGGNYQKSDGQFRVPVVFDNLIHKKQMPVTIGVFINPGSIPPSEPNGKARSNRSFEYDTLSDAYVRFLETEILPEVGKTYKLRQDAAGRAIGGISSGGICAFTAAWQRPDLFSKVLSHVGQFHEHPRRGRVPGHDPQDGAQADPGVPSGRLTGPGQPARQLAAGQPVDGGGAEVHEVRLSIRLRHRRPQREARRRDPAGVAALAVARPGQPVSPLTALRRRALGMRLSAKGC